MKNAQTAKSAPPKTLLRRSAQAEAQSLLGHLTTQGILTFLGGQVVILDAEGRLLACSDQALAALGLDAPYPPDARFPTPEELDLPARGFRFSTLSVPMGGAQALLYIFKNIRDRASQEARVAQRQLLLARSQASAVEDPGRAPEQTRTLRDERDTVLVIDDSPMVLRLLEVLLARENLRVVTSDNGKEGLSLAFEYLPDLVLLDAMMPGLNGFEVCRRLKTDVRTQEIPVLFVTVLRGEADEMAALEAGAIDFIPKPITATTLVARVRNHLELKHSKDSLRALSLMDGLTGIANRRQFDQCLEAEWQRAARDGRPLSLLMGDVDFFKRFNDHFGHAVGDDCLRQVAQVFKAALRRPGDLAARFGGEEFICILPDTDEAGARIVAEEILAGMAARALKHPDSEINDLVTLSLGIATGRPTPAGNPKLLVDEADGNLYEAKRLGRNRIAQGRRKPSSKSTPGAPGPG